MRSDEIKELAQKQGSASNGNLLTDEEKSTYSGFAHKVHELGNKELFMLNAGIADNLTTEEQDIVSFEIKLREKDALDKRNINSMTDYTVDKTVKPVAYETDPVSKKYMYEEKRRMSDMTEDLLDKSKKIIDNTYIKLTPEDMDVAKKRGINAAWKKFLVVDNNGDEIRINSEEIQERFRKRYLKQLSETTGIDYTQLDPNFNDGKYDDIEYTTSDDNMNSASSKNTQKLNDDDYEDD